MILLLNYLPQQTMTYTPAAAVPIYSTKVGQITSITEQKWEQKSNLLYLLTSNGLEERVCSSSQELLTTGLEAPDGGNTRRKLMNESLAQLWRSCSWELERG